MSEGSKEHDWKSCIPLKGIVGSNPTLSAKKNPRRTHLGFLLAQKGGVPYRFND